MRIRRAERENLVVQPLYLYTESVGGIGGLGQRV
jgi:hypothetical protein